MTSSRLLLISAALLLSGSIGALADDMPGSAEHPLTPQQALSRQGQNVSVEGIATVTEASGLTGIYVHLNGADSNAPFVGYIDVDNERQFPNPRELNGKTIEISGVVETMDSLPMIRLTSPDQVRVLR